MFLWGLSAATDAEEVNLEAPHRRCCDHMASCSTTMVPAFFLNPLEMQARCLRCRRVEHMACQELLQVSTSVRSFTITRRLLQPFP